MSENDLKTRYRGMSDRTRCTGSQRKERSIPDGETDGGFVENLASE
jgi:hypothetical protein